MQTLSAILESQPEEVERSGGMLSEPFRGAVKRCLEKEPGARYSKTAELADALRRIEEEFALRPALAESAAVESRPSRPATVGRETTLAELHRGLEQVRSGSGLMLGVAGEAGIGKTTVTETFLSSLLEPVVRGVRIARGRCSERLAGTEAFLPVLEVLESLTRDPTLAESLERWAPSWYGQVARATPDPEQGASQQERLKRELAGFFREITGEHPLVVFLDDLHWADVSTVDLLGYLAMRFDTMRLLIVVTYRKEEMRSVQHPFLDLQLELQSRGVCREVALPFLSREDSRRYLELEFPGHDFPESFPNLLHARTEGSPLFLVDLLRYLRDREVIQKKNGVYILSRAPEDVVTELPQSIQGMIQRKIERLGDDDRRLLELASVQGFELDSAVLATVEARDPGDVEESLQKLERVNAIVANAGEHELPDGTLSLRFRFVHALYQNWLYTSLTPSRRRSWSRQVAETLEGFYGDKRRDVASELAFLYRAARDPLKAAAYLRQAAENAARVSANYEAVSLAEQGLSLIESLPETRERDENELALRAVLAPALTALRGWQHEEVERTWKRAGQLAERIEDLERLFYVSWGLFAYEYVRGDDFTETLERARKLLPIAERLGDDGLELTARWGLGAALYERGELHLSREELGRGLALYDPDRHHHLAVRITDDPGVAIRTYLSQILLLSGFPNRAIEMMDEAWGLAEQLDHPFSKCRVLYIVVSIRFQLGDLPGLQKATRELLSLSEEHGFPIWASYAKHLDGYVLARSGRHDQSESRIRSGMEHFEKAGVSHTLHYRLLVLAEALKLSGKIEDALAAVDEALFYLNRTNGRLFESEAHRLHGELVLAAGKSESNAEASFRRAIEVARRQQAKLLELRAAVDLGGLLKSQGREKEARDRLAPLYEGFTEGFETRDLENAKGLLDDLA